MSPATPLRLDTAACDRCGKCVPKCSAKALRVGPGYILVDWSKCTACGNCVDACDRGAIALRGASVAARQDAGRGAVVPIGAVKEKKGPSKSVPSSAAWSLSEASVVLVLAFALLIGMQALRSTVASEPVWAGILHAGYYAVLASVAWGLARRRGADVLKAFRLDRAPELVNTLLAVAVAIGCWLSAVTYRALTAPPAGGAAPTDGLSGVFGSGIVGMLLTFILVAAVASVLEEALLRGVVLTALAARFGRWIAIVACALAFALLHASWTSVVPLTVLGIAVGWLAGRGRSLWPAIIAHALYNAIFLAFYYAAVR